MERSAVDWRCLEGPDIQELMDHWAKRENIVFAGSYEEAESPDWEYGLSPEERANAQQVLRVFLSQHGVGEELPTALTLLDALALAAGPKWPLEGFFLTPAVLAAIVRLVAKFTLGRNVLGSLSDKSLFLSLLQFELAIEEPAEVTRAELGILAALDGRVWLPSPVDWARFVLWHLEALAGERQEVPEGRADSETSAAKASVQTWAAFITESIAATPWLRPRTLALGACALGLVGAGAIEAEEFRRPEMPEDLWAESLLVEVESKRTLGGASQRRLGSPGACPAEGCARGVGFSAQSPPACAGCGQDPSPSSKSGALERLTLERLAEAACCTPDELREHANYAVAALHAAVAGAKKAAEVR